MPEDKVIEGEEVVPVGGVADFILKVLGFGFDVVVVCGDIEFGVFVSEVLEYFEDICEGVLGVGGEDDIGFVVVGSGEFPLAAVDGMGLGEVIEPEDNGSDFDVDVDFFAVEGEGYGGVRFGGVGGCALVGVFFFEDIFSAQFLFFDHTGDV